MPGYGQGTTQYIYDANGRVTGVITPSGDAAVYHYDPAGNITSIERIGSGGFTVLSFSPQIGTIGDPVTLTGIGLDTASSVSFNGTPAQIVSATPTSLVTSVPDGASTGLITLSGVRGSVTTTTAFAVIARVQVTPALPEILPGESVQFQATVVGSPNQQVTWAVNGITRGNGAIGTNRRQRFLPISKCFCVLCGVIRVYSRVFAAKWFSISVHQRESVVGTAKATLE